MIIKNNWWSIFNKMLCKSRVLKIVSPFVSEQVIIQIKKDFDLSNLELITRYNLRDFAQNILMEKNLWYYKFESPLLSL